ncbi:MAG: hypothetical protein Q9M91_08635 [Candidatus Dojkabacteria bacterium]|nr:hypothetical protein [Candidatus Dojkabacteria bacterium]MDQ7021838.1 hypothetical protein [Candidatus Dojkabacteria bacterium]
MSERNSGELSTRDELEQIDLVTGLINETDELDFKETMLLFENIEKNYRYFRK